MIGAIAFSFDKFFANGDPREQPWDRAALSAGKLVWVDPSVSIGEDDLFLYSRQGELLGVTNAALSLLDISKFLQTLEIGQQCQFSNDCSGSRAN